MESSLFASIVLPGLACLSLLNVLAAAQVSDRTTLRGLTRFSTSNDLARLQDAEYNGIELDARINSGGCDNQFAGTRQLLIPKQSDVRVVD